METVCCLGRFRCDEDFKAWLEIFQLLDEWHFRTYDGLDVWRGLRGVDCIAGRRMQISVKRGSRMNLDESVEGTEFGSFGSGDGSWS